MTAVVPQTPQRPLPGSFLNTPAPSRQTNNPLQNQPTIFRNVPAPGAPANTQNPPPTGQTNPVSQTTVSTTLPGQAQAGMMPIERAARTINATLDEEARYPAMDNYISQGHSSDYEIPSSAAYAPFQKVKMYDIPDRIFEQYNQAQVSTMMGVFADLNHAWITIDNALYLWDYTHPNPELVGFEEQPNSITAVKMVTPRKGVFVDAISRLLVVATASDIFLIGVSSQDTPSGSKSVSLYQTRMHVSIKGISVTCIEGSEKTGRIFFAGRGNDDVYELTYQQEEGWFQNRCSKINQTQKSILPQLPFTQKGPPEYVSQLVVDDTRNLLYSLSSRSTIRVFQLRQPNTLYHSITRSIGAVLSDLGHRVGQSTLLGRETSIINISPIPAREASRLNLMATTSTGCRIFFSAVTSAYFIGGDSSSAPTSMQVHHVKFPPPSSENVQPAQQSPSNPTAPMQVRPVGDGSQSLTHSRLSERYPPGYFTCIVQRSTRGVNDLLFMAAPDTARIAHPQDPSQAGKFPEYGYWLQLDSYAEDISLATPPFSASSNPMGFGNELAVQFDQPVSEIVILTNSGIHTFRRRRLVDVFAAAIRYGSGDEGLEGEVRKFVRSYGRGETIATALAVACGQGSDVAVDSRVTRVTDPEILERARKTFIDHGGKPMVNENSVIDQGAPAIDNVRPSPRHEGLALYISRLLRSVWKASILIEETTPNGGLQIKPALPLTRLQDIQRDLLRLQEFLDSNKSFIEGLAGPEALGRVSTKQEEVALQGEHRAMNSLVKLISDVIEGISFVLVLFDERVEEIVLSISDTARQQVRQMTYERLFCSSEGKQLAKDLVKAIVNRNIAQGSNVDTVTDALRRRCGSFCSADDCVIFKAQEQLKRASDTNSSSETSRNLLNESLRLLQKVAESLSMEQLKWAIELYISMEFYAGAVQLCLTVAQQGDRGNRALAWLNEGSPGNDPRQAIYESRQRCYDLIHDIINAVDRSSSQAPEMVDGQYTVIAKRKREAYDEINESQDEVFQIHLYDWYLSQGWSDRLLEVRSRFVIGYLQRKSLEDVTRADLLWRYYAQYNNFLDAAKVQLTLAKSEFSLTLSQRIEYLSRARANASTKTIGNSDMYRSRQSRQDLIREVSDLLDVANIQEDLLQRMRDETRLSTERRPHVLRHLDGQILSLDELFNAYADQAGYHDLCLLIYQAADHRSAPDIKATWLSLIDSTHADTANKGEPLPWEAVGEKVRALGVRLNLSELTFPIPTLLPLLVRYALDYTLSPPPPPNWALALFLTLRVPPAALVAALEPLLYTPEPPFTAQRARRAVAGDLLRALQRWWDDTSAGASATGSFRDSTAAGERGVPFGGEDNAAGVAELLGVLVQREGERVLGAELLEEARALRARVERALRR